MMPRPIALGLTVWLCGCPSPGDSDSSNETPLEGSITLEVDQAWYISGFLPDQSETWCDDLEPDTLDLVDANGDVHDCWDKNWGICTQFFRIEDGSIDWNPWVPVDPCGGEEDEIVKLRGSYDYSDYEVIAVDEEGDTIRTDHGVWDITYWQGGPHLTVTVQETGHQFALEVL